MKQLKDFITEAITETILANPEDLLSISDDDLAVEIITDWIDKNWVGTGEATVRFEGKTRVVDYNGHLKPRTGEITNGMFVWGNVTGDFEFCMLDTDIQKTKTLVGIGLPRYVGGTLNLHSFKKVTNLEGLPDTVGSLYIAGFTKLTSLKGCPSNVENNFTITLCAALKGLDYLPDHIGGDISINHNVNLLSIDGLSRVTNVVNGDLYLNGNYKLKSLQGCPSIVDGTFSCEKCKALTSLSYCPEQVKYNFYCKHCATRFTVSQVQELCSQMRPGYTIDAYKK